VIGPCGLQLLPEFTDGLCQLLQPGFCLRLIEILLRQRADWSDECGQQDDAGQGN